jgi:hypothetical protein
MLQVFKDQKEYQVMLQGMVFQASQVSLGSKVHVESKDKRVNLVHLVGRVWKE